MFTPAEESYLKSQLLARLATVAPDGTVQNSPVGFFFNDELNTFDIWGQRMRRTKKFANVASYPRVALVIDDLASVNPWIARGIEIRGLGEPLSDLEPPRALLQPRSDQDPPKQDHHLGPGRGRSLYLTSDRHGVAG